MRPQIRHRYALAIPFALLAFIVLVGGLFNAVDAQGRLLDDYTEEGVEGGSVKLGSRVTWSDATGVYAIEDVPRTARLRIEAPGYLIASAPPEGGVVRLTPLAVTIQVNEAGTNGQTGVAIAQIRIEDGSRTLGTTNVSGNTVISPHPGRDASVLVCALNYVTRVVPVEGVAQVIELTKSEGSDCPPLPTPSPGPSPSVTPAPSVTPTAEPSPSPSPTNTP